VKAATLHSQVANGDIEPPAALAIGDNDGLLGGCGRIGANTFITAWHVIEDLSGDWDESKEFHLFLAGHQTDAVLIKKDEDADLAWFSVSDPLCLQAPIQQVDYMTRDCVGVVPTNKGAIPMKLRYVQDEYFVAENCPLTAGNSGDQFITSKGQGAVYVGAQPGRIGVFRAIPFDVSPLLLSEIDDFGGMEYTAHAKGKNKKFKANKSHKMLKKARAADFSEEAYEAAVTRVVDQFGWEGVRGDRIWAELQLERSYQQWADGNAGGYGTEDSGDFLSDDLDDGSDWGAEEGDFAQNDYKDAKGRVRDDYDDGEEVEQISRKLARNARRGLGYVEQSTRQPKFREGDMYVSGASDLTDIGAMLVGVFSDEDNAEAATAAATSGVPLTTVPLPEPVLLVPTPAVVPSQALPSAPAPSVAQAPPPLTGKQVEDLLNSLPCTSYTVMVDGKEVQLQVPMVPCTPPQTPPPEMTDLERRTELVAEAVAFGRLADTRSPRVEVEEEKSPEPPNPVLDENARLRAEMEEMRKMMASLLATPNVTNKPVPVAPPAASANQASDDDKRKIAMAVLAAQVTSKDLANVRYETDLKEITEKIAELEAEGIVHTEPIVLEPLAMMGKSKRDIDLLVLRRKLKSMENKKKFFELNRERAQEAAKKMARVQGLINAKMAEAEDAKQKLEELKKRMQEGGLSTEDF
jgi:hypothetical protein